MVSFPNCKINLGLNVVSKREDSYHNIETVFYPVDVCDVLEFVPSRSNGLRFFESGLRIGGNFSDNSVVKAYDRMKQKFDLPPLEIYLKKNIPSGAGLGGGSSDASFMIRMLNDFFHLGLSLEEMESYAFELGSDCPFFIRNVPMYAEGRGNLLSPMELNLGKYVLVLVKPECAVSTREAYSGIRPKEPKWNVREIVKFPVSEWKDLLFNDFEEKIFSLYPEIPAIKSQLYERGALYASMSGSGSSVYGIFEENILPEDINMKYWYKKVKLS